MAQGGCIDLGNESNGYAKQPPVSGPEPYLREILSVSLTTLQSAIQLKSQIRIAYSD